MAIGWIRAYGEENAEIGNDIPFFSRKSRADFRKDFKTTLRASASGNAASVKTLKWGDKVELPNGLSTSTWTKAISASKEGFIKSSHVVEIAYVKRKSGSTDKAFKAKLEYLHFDYDSRQSNLEKRDVIWGDLVQITKRGASKSEVRVRGIAGTMNTDDLGPEALLETYFIDVGQGDGVLVTTPDFKHILIDGGLQRKDQQTGKNAADFIDWKFFMDYGDFRIRLDSLMASHSDMDHFGGLHDLVRTDEWSMRELDCLGTDIKTFHHPGLSRWTTITNAIPKHRDGLGPRLNGGFIRLLDDRADAEKSLSTSGSPEKLSRPWSTFITDVLANSSKTTVKRVCASKEDIQSGKPLPKLWPSAAGLDIKILAPVTYQESGHTALKDLGDKGKNTNGHSICLRLDYGDARFLLTGDLNQKSMNWLEECYGDDSANVWRSDVAKACHHGSHDISYRFLEYINAAATVISSGDAEGHAHPRPEIVAASALSGRKTIDEKKDRLKTPLIYMTEIERSVTLGSINRIDIRQMPIAGGQRHDGTITGRPVDEIEPKGFLSPKARKDLKDVTSSTQKRKIVEGHERTEEPILAAMEDDTEKSKIRVDFNLSVPLGPIGQKNVKKGQWRGYMLQKVQYGLVTTRTDGETVMCATMDEHGKKWIVHTFPAAVENEYILAKARFV